MSHIAEVLRLTWSVKSSLIAVTEDTVFHQIAMSTALGEFHLE